MGSSMNLPPLPIDGICSGYVQSMNWLAGATSRNVTVLLPPFRTGCPNHSGYDFINKKALNIYNTANPYPTGTPTVVSGFGISGILNVPFSGGTVCPVCFGNGNLNYPVSGTVPARIRWRGQDSDFEVGAGGSVQKMEVINGDVRLKVTGQADVAMLDRAEGVIVDGIMCGRSQSKYPVGLRDIHTYIYTFNKTS